MKQLIVPMIHLNGDRKETLQAELRKAVDALNKAETALQALTIHGRNYYCHPELAQNAGYTQARSEQMARIRKIESIVDELMALWNGIDENQLYVEVEAKEKEA